MNVLPIAEKIADKASKVLGNNYPKDLLHGVIVHPAICFTTPVMATLIHDMNADWAFSRNRSDEMALEKPTLDIFQHYKGDYYKLMCEAVLEETGLAVVVYREINFDGRGRVNNQIYVRPSAEFFCEVEWQGTIVQRFARVK